MKIELNDLYSISLRIFTILREEFSLYLSEDKKEKLENIDIFHFYKIINDKNMPLFSFFGDICYLNSYYNIDLDYLPFICLSYLCGNLNPLKIGLIELKIKE